MFNTLHRGILDDKTVYVAPREQELLFLHIKTECAHAPSKEKGPLNHKDSNKSQTPFHRGIYQIA